MIIYLEGPDGSGKTTLAQTIAKVLVDKNITIPILSAEEHIPTRPNREDRVNERQLFKQLKIMALSDKVYVIDRGPISDIIYRCFDNAEPVTTLNKVIKFLQKYNNKVMLVYCNSDSAYENMIARGDDNPVAVSQHSIISKMFKVIMNEIEANIDFNFQRYNYDIKSSIDTVTSNIAYFCYMGLKNIGV